MALINYTGPEPVTVDEAKLAARIDGNELNDVIASLIASAREQAEDLTGRCYRGQTRRYEVRDWPTVCDELPVFEATDCEVTYWTGDAWSTALDPSAFVFAPGGLGGIATLVAPATTWPTLGARIVGPRVRIDLTAGPEDEARPVPDQVKTYIKASVSAWLSTPEAQRQGTLTPNPLFERLLDGQRLRN